MTNNVEITEIVEQAIENIREIFDIRMKFKANNGNSASSTTDGVLVIGEVQFACVLKKKVTDYNINAVIGARMQSGRNSDMPLLVLSGDIPGRLMHTLWENGICSMDSAGNCYIRQGGLMMCCQGRKNSNLSKKESLSFKEPGLKVLYFILSDLHNVNLPFREIQAETGVGLATINKLFSSLKQNGYLFLTGTGRHLKNTMGLLSVFVDNYCRVMKPKCFMASLKFLPDKRERWSDVLLPSGMEWGGEPGAYVKERYLVPEVYDIYSNVGTGELTAARIAVPARNGEIRVFRKFWSDESNDVTAPALIIYADLMGSGDSRCIEAAQRLFDHELSYLR